MSSNRGFVFLVCVDSSRLSGVPTANSALALGRRSPRLAFLSEGVTIGLRGLKCRLGRRRSIVLALEPTVA